MSAIDPIVLTHAFAADSAAAGLVDIAQLDAQLALIVAGHQEHNDLLATLLRGDLTLKDGLVRLRNLHAEVTSALQLIFQGVADGSAHVTPAARVASTSNLALTGTQTIDGVACIAGDVAFLHVQTDPSENGLWTVAAGAWSRTTDADTWDDLRGGFVWVDEGTANEGTQWALVLDEGGTIDVDPIEARLLFRAASSLANLDPAAVATAAPTVLDYVLIHDVSAGAMRRALMSALPFLLSTTVHNDLGGRADPAAHAQYVLKAGDTMAGALAMGAHPITGLPLTQDDNTDEGDGASLKYVREKVASSSARRPGDVFVHAGAAAPADAYVCNGDPVSRTGDAALFAAIGTIWGPGDGSTTFNIPNALGRTIIGAGASGGVGLTARAIAASGGEEQHTLALTEIPAHHHTSITVNGSGTGLDTPGSFGPTPQNTGDSGGGLPHENMPPFLAMLVCIQR